MKRMVKLLLATLLLLTLSLGLMPAVAEELEPMDIVLHLWGDKPNQMDEVLAEFVSRTQDELNINLDITWTPQADYTNNIKLKLAAGERVDMCFDAPWMNMNTFILQGNYRDLTDYFLNDDYPNLKAAFNEDFLSNNLMGENGDRVYGIPLTQSFGAGHLVYLRGDLREKYGLDPITSYEGFVAYLQKVKEEEASMVPYAMKNDGHYGAEVIFTANHPEKDIGKYEAGIWDLDIADGVTATLLIEDYEIKSVIMSADASSAKADFPAPFNQEDTDALRETRDWYEKGYIDADVITVDDAAAQFTSGKAASFTWDAAQYSSVESQLTASVPEAKLEVYEYDPIVANDVPGMKKGAYTAWNFICIPVTTSDEMADRIMLFFDWMFASSENHDLFEFGIEGVHFTAIGEDEYSYPEGIDLTTNYNFPGYELTWNPNYIRYPAGYPENVLHTMKSANDPATYFDPLLSGMRFNGDPVKNEIANPDFQEIKTRKANMKLGIFADIDAELAAIDEAIAGNKILQEDMAKIKEEVIRQVTPYLAERKAQDEAAGRVYPTLEALEASLNP